MTIFEYDRGLVIHLSELPSDETDHTMFEIMGIIEEDGFRGIDILEGFLEMMLGGSLACLIQVLEFLKESIDSLFSCEEPLQGGDRSIHTTSGIDTWSYLESDQIRIEEFWKTRPSSSNLRILAHCITRYSSLWYLIFTRITSFLRIPIMVSLEKFPESS